MLKISRKNIWKETGLFCFIDNIIVHMNPEVDSGGDDERESSDTEDRSDCSSSEEMWTCSQHSHCNVNDICFCTDNSCSVMYLHQTSTHPMLPAFFKYLQSFTSPELDSTFCMTCIVI